MIIIYLLIIIGYLSAVQRSNQKFQRWPRHRTFCFMFGILAMSITMIGPLAKLVHESFIYHMIGHLLTGMLAPLLLVLSAPMTLLLRTVNVKTARRLSRLLRSRFVRFYRNPIVASILNIGGLWVLYTTPLFMWSHQSAILYVLVHIHVFVAGYLFTISLLYIDPAPFRYSYLYRTIVFIFALAGHGILSKYIYAYPPIGVATREAEIGGMLMYYGGDAIDIVIITILFYQWYRATKPRTRFSTVT